MLPIVHQWLKGLFFSLHRRPCYKNVELQSGGLSPAKYVEHQHDYYYCVDRFPASFLIYHTTIHVCVYVCGVLCA